MGAGRQRCQSGHLLAFPRTMPFTGSCCWRGDAADRPGRQWLNIGITALGLLFVLEPWRGVGSAPQRIARR